MKKFGLVLAMLALVLAGCSNGTTAPVFDKEFNVSTIEAFDAVIEEIKNTPGEYLIKVNADLLDHPGVQLQTNGVNITVRGTGSNRITWNAESTALFRIEAGKLTLENITLSCVTDKTQNNFLIRLRGGVLEVKKGVIISIKSGRESVGIHVQPSGGTLIMSGGIIENCDNGVILEGTDLSMTMSGGEIRNCNNSGIGTWGRTERGNITINITGGRISNNGTGIGIARSGTTVTFSGGTTENCGIGISAADSTVSITGGKIDGRIGTNSTGNNFTISGGEIIGGIDLGSGNKLTMSGGKISADGIYIGNENTVIFNGGTIENCEHGIGVGGNGNSITVSRGTIRNITYHGIGLWDSSANCTVDITGGEITGGSMGVFLQGSNETVNISGGKVHGEEWFGVGVGNGSGHIVTKTGGTVTGGTGPYWVSDNASAVVTGF